MDSTGQRDPHAAGPISRRDFLKAGGAGAVALSAAASAGAGATRRGGDDRAVILLMLVGGPSQLETFDPKPDAPAEVRGPFGSIATAVPGVRVNEFLPGLARRMDRVALVRSVYHDAAPIHETGHQLLQTGRLCRPGQEFPHLGSVASRVLGPRNGIPASVLLGGPIGNTGVSVSHGDTPGDLGPAYAPFCFAPPRGVDPKPGAVRTLHDLEPGCDRRALLRLLDLTEQPDSVRDAYGCNTFGMNCLRARLLVEAGARVVTVTMFPTVFKKLSWDAHGSAPFSTLDDYRRALLPRLDTAISALLDDLAGSGRLGSTLVVAAGEFGRTPRLNASGGRDHWPGVWSALLAGGGVRGGQVIGSSDAHASEPTDRPVPASALVATMYHSLGLDPGSPLPSSAGTDSPRLALVDAAPVAETFA